MRPIKLTMSAFGPYADLQELDFTTLGNHMLFLICGPTGAGKSTILDAMCYALYGRTSGEMRTGESMRSSHATLERETYVEFDFCLGDKYYRVHRSPTQQAKRKRGDTDKPVEKAGKALFNEIDNKGNVIRNITTKGVEKAVEDLLGIGFDQFRQIILLPQGDFKDLLLAGSSQRQEIMQKLFGTYRYGLIEQKLKRMVLDLEHEVTGMRERIATLLTTQEFASTEALKQCIIQDAALEKEKRKKWKELEQEQKLFQESYSKVVALNDAFSRLSIAKESLSGLESKHKEMQQKTIELDKIKAAERLAPTRNALVELFKNRLDKKKAIEKGINQFEIIAKRKEEAELAFDAIQKDKEKQEEMAKKLTILTTLKPEVEKFEEITGALAKAKQEWEQVQLTYQKLDDVYKTAEEKVRLTRNIAEALAEKFTHNQASFLANTLEDGKPCPVCGSLVHPKPSAYGEESITKEDVKQAKKQAVDAEQMAKEARGKHEEYRNKELLLKKDTYVRTESLWAELHRKIPQEFKQLKVLNKKIQELDSICNSYEKQRHQIETLLNESKQEFEKQKACLQILKNDLSVLNNTYENSYSDFKKKIREEGFSDEKEQQRYNQRIPQIKELTEELTAYEADIKSAKQIIENESKRIAGEKKPDIEAWNKQRDTLDGKTKTVLSELTRLEEQYKTRKKTLEEIEKLETLGAEKEKKHAVIGGLHMVIRGTETGVNLERFVLGALLDDVTRKADVRLSVMSGGRYQLQRARGERVDARKTGGLDLEVMDSYTGKSRVASTLSGGETFLASLSLALGLADVVQEYAGGVHLDSMFIDEGFGSLDQETLDLAMKTLIAMQGQNRMIGIISHVSELEERITTRLRIEKTQRGSIAAFEIDG